VSVDENGFAVGLLPPILRAFFVVVGVDGIFFGFAAFSSCRRNWPPLSSKEGRVKQAWSFPTDCCGDAYGLGGICVPALDE